MIVGFDTDGSGKSCCFAKEWPLARAGVLLTATGTEMDINAICDGIRPSCEYAAALLQNCLDDIAQSNGAEDLVYAGTKLVDCCNGIHRRVLEIGDFAGQGIYLSGVIIYIANSQFLMIPFGGGCLYGCENNHLRLLNAQVPGRIIRDAIGGAREWTGHCWQGAMIPDLRLLFTCAPVDIVACDQIIRQNSAEQSHVNTVSMLIRRNLESALPGSTTAVMEIRL